MSLTFCVVLLTHTSLCVARIRLTLPLCAADLRARLTAIDLTTVAASTDDHLYAATGTQKESGTGTHRLTRPMSAGFNPCTSETLQGLCESTVYYGVASNLTVKSWLTLRPSQRLIRFTPRYDMRVARLGSLYAQELDDWLKNSEITKGVLICLNAVSGICPRFYTGTNSRLHD